MSIEVTPQRGQLREELRVWRRVAIIAALLALVAVALAAVAASRQPEAAAAPETLPQSKVEAQLDRNSAKLSSCAQLAATMDSMADAVDKAFAEHAHAHHLFQQKKIAMGPVDKPGTVLWIWRKTLADRERYSPLYRQARKAWNRRCAT